MPGGQDQPESIVEFRDIHTVHHEGTHRRLPTNGGDYRWVGDPNRGVDRRQPGGWIFTVLPFLEQETLWALGKGRQDTDLDDALGQMLQTPLAVFTCPSRRVVQSYPYRWVPFNAASTDGAAKSDYAINSGDVFFDAGSGPITLEQAGLPLYAWPDYRGTGIAYLRSEVRLADVVDGTSNTYLIGEKNVPGRLYTSGTCHGYFVGQVMHGPGGATEEIVEAVERMPLGSGYGRIGLGGLEHSILGSLAQAHHPTEQHLDVRLERWLGKCWQQALNNGVERGYARKHGRGPPCLSRASPTLVTTRSVQGTPPSLHRQNQAKICESSDDRTVANLNIEVFS